MWAQAVVAGAHTSGVHTGYAIALIHREELDLATQHLLKAVELKPSDGRAWFVLGNLMRDQGELGPAGYAYSQAALTLPQAYMAYANLGGVLMQLGHIKEGIQAFRDAVADLERPRTAREGKGSPMPYLALGAALVDTGSIEEGRQYLLKAAQFPELAERAQAILQTLPPPEPR
jgi:tetratricopeptide (TPR) repeat protein